MQYLQTQIIAKVKELALNDEAVSAVLMYGSFTRGEGDAWSDVEFYLFCRQDVAPAAAWVARVMPVLLFFRNEFGTDVAIFENLIRGEFHFKSMDDVTVVKTWQGLVSFEHAANMILVDKDGLLAAVFAGIDTARPKRDAPENILWLAQSLSNNLLHVQNLLFRGEAAHAHLHFQYIVKYLLWLIRLAARNDDHWEGPSKNLENEVPPARYAAYAACAPSLRPDSLRESFDNALNLAGELFAELNVPPGPRLLLEKIADRKRLALIMAENQKR